MNEIEAEDLMSQTERENDKVIAHRKREKGNEDCVLSPFDQWCFLHASWKFDDFIVNDT